MTESSSSFSAVVTDIRLESRVGAVARWHLALDSTLFSLHATSGTLTAIAASGARLEVPVLGVIEEDGLVWHIVDKPLTEGTQVSGQTVQSDSRGWA
jgi:alanyl-tRNA synthetase